MAEPQKLTLRATTPNVHKFGGSSLKDAECIEQVVETIVQQVNKGDFLVVSANGKVTDLLLSVIQGNSQSRLELQHYLTGLLESVLDQTQQLQLKIKQDLLWLAEQTTYSGVNPHEILALGELWSAQLLSAKLNEAGINNQWCDARTLFIINQQHQLVNQEFAKTQLRHLSSSCDDGIEGPKLLIITGFIARNTEGQSTTFGRNGSDYTATLVADLVQSSTVHLWTDVDGVYTADPHVIKQARRIEHLSMAEAQALSELGSNVLHHKTIAPILHKPPRLVISACDSNSTGTVVEKYSQPIAKQEQLKEQQKIKTLAFKANLVFLSVIEVDELKARQFQAQLTAEHIANYANHYDKTSQSFNFYVEKCDLFVTIQLIKASKFELNQQQSNISLISAVGENIRQNRQVITKLLNRSEPFAVHNIHYPANDHTLCILLPDQQAPQLLQDLHHTFFGLEPSIPIVVLGFGNIGQQFLDILKNKKNQIEQQVQQSLSVVAVANSRCYQFDEQCLLSQQIELNEPNEQGQLLQKLKAYEYKPLALIDLTASESVAAKYLQFAENGWHLISANKMAAADDVLAGKIEKILQQHQRVWLKNTTVGAALPIQDTIKKIKQSGDQIKQVSGVFSGSLSWLFGQYDGQSEFMDWVKQAHQSAYTEPDPREDLSGQDVYRKALILARECGFEAKNIRFKPVLPEQLLKGSINEFWHNADNINSYLKDLWQQAEIKRQQLRYLATVNADEITVELVAVEQNHAAVGLKPGDNIFIIESDWYADNPLIIQGPGAGKEVTAAGVLNDLIEVLQSSC